MEEDSVTIANLKAQLARSEDRRREEELKLREAESKRREAELKRREAELKRREAERKRKAAEASLHALERRTTFEEYLNLLQKHHATKLSYDLNCTRNTTGGVTNPRQRITPTVITAWEDFEGEQAATYQEFCEVFQNKRLFPSELEVLATQKTINDFLITSEKGLTNFTDTAEVLPIKEIVNHFIVSAPIDGVPGLEVSFSPGQDPDDDTQAAFAPVDGFWNRGGPIMLLELKPPYKLPPEALRTALDDGAGRPRSRFETKPIIDSPHVTSDPTYTIVAVFTQVFDYMITSGVKYAWLYTGMASVYFQVLRQYPTTLHFHLKIHSRSSTADPKETSVCQNAIFVRRCLSAKKRDADWIRNAVDSNAHFLVDPEAQLNLMSSSRLSIKPEIVSPGKEDYMPPKRKRMSSPRVDRPYHRIDDTSDYDIGGDSSSIHRRSAGHSRTRDTRNRHGNADIFMTLGTGGDGEIQCSQIAERTVKTGCMFCAPADVTRQYCSQACLRGLGYSSKTKIPQELDAACPNAARHSKTTKHELTLDQFHDLLQRQLDRTHNHAIEYLDLSGSSGQIYAITLCSHGYTFVGKGSRSHQVPSLVHELGIYESSHPLQGSLIPVCLGLLHLDGPCYLESPNPITHFLLLSFSGIPVRCRSELIPPADVVISSAKTALKKLHDFNITHRNFCVENLLWNTDLQSVMIVDFGMSVLLEIPDLPSSVTHHVSSRQRGDQRVVQVGQKLSSSAGLRKTQISRRYAKLKFLLEVRQCELAAVEEEVRRWLPAPAT